MTKKPAVAIVGAGSLATFLAPAVRKAGYRITEIIARGRAKSLSRARTLAARVGARVATVETAALNAELLWFCVPDREIRAAAGSIALHGTGGVKFAFHSSGALLSVELHALRSAGVTVASAHPLMTFVPRSKPSLTGVPFALEGDAAAVRLARRLVRDLGGESFSLSSKRKAAYHAWATMTSPLLLAYLVTLEEAANAAGLRRADARRMSLPIIRQTLENYAKLGPLHSFSGPFIRGDAETVAKHMTLLKRHRTTRGVYAALARNAIDLLPVKNRTALRRLLEK
jgi:predicted short-subunit dehydrogenase-like oxidoreductase (DUF2520 family)